MELKKGALLTWLGLMPVSRWMNSGMLRTGVDQRLEGVHYLVALELDRANFDDGVPALVQTRGFQVNGHVDRFKWRGCGDTQSHRSSTTWEY